MLEIAREIESIKGEELDWNISLLNIDEGAWNKIIHRGIKPVTVFAHPRVLESQPKRISYYRMLAMVSQKSMDNVGLPVIRYETDNRPLSQSNALAISKHLNKIISDLINSDEVIDPREFDIWRGMAAGTQAQGSWQNEKGAESARLVSEMTKKHIKARGLISLTLGPSQFRLKDGRELIIGKEPDIGIYDATGRISIAVEIKGGIDTAGVLERLGAALKSLSRAKRENPQSKTILILPSVAMTKAFQKDVKAARDVDYCFTLDEVINEPLKQKEFFNLLGL
jgi:hypothetical protein